MLVSVTRLRLRSPRFLPAFALATIASARQATRAPGFLGGRLLHGGGLTFWTLTAWSGERAMREYRNAGAHRRAMALLPRWCDEAAFARWELDGERIPGWAEVWERFAREAKFTRLPHPSPDHRAGRVPPPRAGAGLTLRPRGRAAAGTARAAHMSD